MHGKVYQRQTLMCVLSVSPYSCSVRSTPLLSLFLVGGNHYVPAEDQITSKQQN